MVRLGIGMGLSALLATSCVDPETGNFTVSISKYNDDALEVAVDIDQPVDHSTSEDNCGRYEIVDVNYVAIFDEKNTSLDTDLDTVYLGFDGGLSLSESPHLFSGSLEEGTYNLEVAVDAMDDCDNTTSGIGTADYTVNWD